MFQAYRESSKYVFGIDLAHAFADVMLPYCQERKCALIPTGIQMKKVEKKTCGNDSDSENTTPTKPTESKRLWIAVTRRVAQDKRKRLATQPVLMM